MTPALGSTRMIDTGNKSAFQKRKVDILCGFNNVGPSRHRKEFESYLRELVDRDAWDKLY